MRCGLSPILSWGANPDGYDPPGAMKRQNETEIKLEVRDPRALKRRLAELGFRRVKARHFESNHLFDFPDHRLRRGRRLLRLRFAGRQDVLTYKGAPLHSRAYKVRREIETAVEDGHRLKEVLESLGFRQTFYHEKYRTIYAPPGQPETAQVAHLFYDELPFGNYLELEGAQRWIDEAARQLGYSPEDYITRSYIALHRQKCLEQGRKMGNIVFPAHKS
jgi:adenylate cyclase class 2